MTGMVWRCGHARTAENSTNGRRPQCRICSNAAKRNYRRSDAECLDTNEGVLSAQDVRAGSDNLLRAICREHLAIVSHFAAQGRNVRVLL